MATDATITQGDEMTLRWTLYSDENETTAYDCTNCTIELRVGDLDLRKLRFSRAGAVDDGPNGAVSVDLLEADTSSLPPNDYHMQLIVTDQTGIGITASWGTLTVKRRLPAS